MANLYITEMPTYRYSYGDAYGGDHMCFNIHEYPALYIGDVEYHQQNTYYHTAGDTIGAGVNCFALAEGFVKGVVAATAELANGWMAPQDFSAIVKNENVFLSWNEAPETESYKVFKDGELLVETTENSFVDEAFVDGEWHRYHVIGIKADGEESPASNPDSVLTREPLQLPVFYDFDDGTAEGLVLNNNNWSFVDNILKSVTHTRDNIFQTAEFQWFSIPETVEDVALGLKIMSLLSTVWNRNVNLFVEVTTDRKTWHKLAKLTLSNQAQWREYDISLNDFIGCDYVQPRIRFEGSGIGETVSFGNTLRIDDLYITFDPTSVSERPVGERFSLTVSPNPTEGMVTLTTGLERSYNVSVYNINGARVITKKSFFDGTLDLSTLAKGTYFISVDNGIDSITKRVVVQ